MLHLYASTRQEDPLAKVMEDARSKFRLLHNRSSPTRSHPTSPPALNSLVVSSFTTPFRFSLFRSNSYLPTSEYEAGLQPILASSQRPQPDIVRHTVSLIPSSDACRFPPTSRLDL